MLAGKHSLRVVLLYIVICLVSPGGLITTASPIGSSLGKYCSRWFGGCSGQPSQESISPDGSPSYSPTISSPSSSRPLAMHDLPLDPSQYPNSGLPGAPYEPTLDDRSSNPGPHIQYLPRLDPSRRYGVSADTLESDPSCSTAPSNSNPNANANANANANGPRLDRCERWGSSSGGHSPSTPELSPHHVSPGPPSMSQDPIVGTTGNQASSRFKNVCSKLGNSLTSCFMGSPDTQSTEEKPSRWRPSLDPIQESISQETTPQASPQRQNSESPNGSPSANPIAPANVNGPPQRTSRWRYFGCRFPNPFSGCRPKTSPEPPPAAPITPHGSPPVTTTPPEDSNRQVAAPSESPNQQSQEDLPHPQKHWSSTMYEHDQDNIDEDAFKLPDPQTRLSYLPNIQEETAQNMREARGQLKYRNRLPSDPRPYTSPNVYGTSQPEQTGLLGKRPLDSEAEPSRNQRPRFDAIPLPAVRPSPQTLSPAEAPPSWLSYDSTNGPLKRPLDSRYAPMVVNSPRLNKFPRENYATSETAMSSIVPVSPPVNAQQNRPWQWNLPKSMRTTRSDGSWSLPFQMPKVTSAIPSSPDEQKPVPWRSPKSPPRPTLTKEMLNALPVDERLRHMNMDHGTTGGLESASHSPPSLKSAYYHSDGSVHTFDGVLDLLSQEREAKAGASVLPPEAMDEENGPRSRQTSPQSISQQDSISGPGNPRQDISSRSPSARPDLVDSDMFSGTPSRRRRGPSFQDGNGIAVI